MNEDELSRWIERVVGFRPPLSRVGYGASRATYVVDLGGGGDLVARVDTGDGPMAGTELSLGREAEVYRALSGTSVRIPRLRAVADDGSALLVERAAGTHEMTGLSDATRTRIYDDYLEALAGLHAVSAAALDLPSFRRPTDGPSHAHEELQLWGGILDGRTTQPWPLAHFARMVLQRFAPREVSRTVLCHGDFGPGNFMHDGRQVTAMVDWEFSHIGDPMDDLGWWVFRGHDMAGGCGDLAAQLAAWSSSTGLPVDTRSIEYYRTFVMFRWLVCVASALDNAGPGMDRSVYFGLLPVLSVRLTRALAGLLDVALSEAPAPPPAERTPAATVLDALRSDLRDVIGPAVQTSEARRRMGAAVLYLTHLDALDRIGRQSWQADIEDLEFLTGRRAGARTAAGLGAAGLAAAELALSELVAGPAPPCEEITAYFWRRAHRQVHLWPAAASRALAPPTVVPEVPAGGREMHRASTHRG